MKGVREKENKGLRRFLSYGEYWLNVVTVFIL